MSKCPYKRTQMNIVSPPLNQVLHTLTTAILDMCIEMCYKMKGIKTGVVVFSKKMPTINNCQCLQIGIPILSPDANSMRDVYEYNCLGVSGELVNLV